MSARRIHTSPDQGELFAHLNADVISTEMPRDVFTDPMPAHVDPSIDPNPGLSTPLVEGWRVIHLVNNNIARERSNRGFVKLPERSMPVKSFADRVDLSNAEAQGLVDDSAGRKYESAQIRLFDYWKKQQERSRDYIRRHPVFDSKVIEDMLPVPVGMVEHRFFHANNPAEAARKEKNRRVISAFVKKNS